MEEIVACINFIDYFTEKFAAFSSCYKFSMTDLCTKISELATHKDNRLVFYLHNSRNEFSINFCNFLQDPVIKGAFHSARLMLYCWDLGSNNLNKKLMEGFKNVIGRNYLRYFKENRSVVLIIKLNNGVPSVVDVFDDSIGLIRLHDLLVKHSSQEKNVTPLSYQKLMATYFGNRDYTRYEENESELLKKNIGYALYGPPTETNEDNIKYHLNQQEEINKLFLQILKQNDVFCERNGEVVISFIFICAEALPEDKLNRAGEHAKKKQSYNPDADFIPYPVFILQKCKHYDYLKACRIIIDHEGRVYQSWNAYLENNRLPPCKMFYPEDGRYRSEKGIKFNTRSSPACDLSKKIGAGTDIAAAVTGIVAGGVGISLPAAAAALPVVAAAAPIVIPVAVAIGIGTAIYGAARSVHSLVDRGIHKQDISLSDPESRAALLTIVGGTLSAGMYGATTTVSALASRGVQMGQGVKYALYGINGVNLAVNGIGIANIVYEAAQAGDVSPLQVVQISTSILFFANAVYSHRAITNIIEESQGTTWNNRFRRMFHTFFEAPNPMQEIQGKVAIISTVRNMENVNKVLNTLTRSNTMLNDLGIQFSVQDGQICLNGVPVDMTTFGNGNNLSDVPHLRHVPPIPENLTPNAQHTITENVHKWLRGIGLLHRLITTSTVEQLVNEIFSLFEGFAHNFIMDISKRFFNRLHPAIAKRIDEIITNSITKTMRWIMNKLQDSHIFKKVLIRQPVSFRAIDDVVKDLEGQFHNAYVNCEYDTAKNEERIKARRVKKKGKVNTTCKVCSGYYYV